MSIIGCSSHLPGGPVNSGLIKVHIFLLMFILVSGNPLLENTTSWNIRTGISDITGFNKKDVKSFSNNPRITRRIDYVGNSTISSARNSKISEFWKYDVAETEGDKDIAEDGNEETSHFFSTHSDDNVIVEENSAKIVENSGENKRDQGNNNNNNNHARGFSMYGLLETIVTTVGGFVGDIVGIESRDTTTPSNKVSYKDYQLLRVLPKTETQVKTLRDLRDHEPEDIKFWTQPYRNKTTDILVSPEVVSDVKSFLKQQKLKFKVLISDLQKIISRQNPKFSKEQRADLVANKGHSMTWKRYHRYRDITQFLDYLGQRYPKMVDIVTIGNSFQRQPIQLARVSSGPKKNGEPKPVIWIDAGMHAREWIGTAVATYILGQLVERNNSYAKLLNAADWMILPVANPDGYEFSHTEDRLWRKTRSSYDTDEDARYTPSGLLHYLTHYTRWFWSKCEGVDPNRNFDYHWGRGSDGGASSDPCHETYAGPSAFSEPETKAMADYIMANKENIRMYLTLHSYSQMWLVPWGHTRTKPSDYTDLMTVARKATKAIAKVHGTQYKAGLSSELLYPTTGSSDDWAKGAAGIKYAYTVELRDRGTYGFLLPASQIVPTARETWSGIRAIVRQITSDTK